MTLPFLAIEIHIDPTMAELGPFTVAWHGFFTAVGIIAGVTLAVRLARAKGLDPGVGQEIALVGVPSAIVGARLFYVAEHWNRFSGDLPRILTGITEGGITLYGGLIGGVLGGLAYGVYRRVPTLRFLDVAAPGMILGQAIGRLGDLITESTAARRPTSHGLSATATRTLSVIPASPCIPPLGATSCLATSQSWRSCSSL